jgi:hypothetical protein
LPRRNADDFGLLGKTQIANCQEQNTTWHDSSVHGILVRAMLVQGGVDRN